MEPQETARRLRLLAEKLKTVPDEKFRMESWVTLPEHLTPSPPPGDKELLVPYTYSMGFYEVQRSYTPECGTAACALGWASTIPELSLFLVRKHPWSPSVDVLHLPGAHTASALFTTGVLIREGLSINMSAGMDAFGIDREEAQYLFDPVPGKDRPCVIERLELLAKRYEKSVAPSTPEAQ